MPSLNAQHSASSIAVLNTATSQERFNCADAPFWTEYGKNGLSLQSLRLLLGLLALILTIFSLSGCGGGWGEYAPTITAAVQSQTVKVGQTATFTVAATGTGPITYQWYKNAVAIPNAKGLTMSMVAAASDDQDKISASATNAGGTSSSAGTLTVLVAPTITTQPLGQSIVSGETATFTVVATGTAPLSYQWYQNGVAIAGANAASYTTPAITAAGSSAFTVTVSNPAGSVTSGTATLTVSSATPTLVFAPIATQTFGNPSFAVIATSASTGAVTYNVTSGPATVAGNAITITGVGPVVVTASQAASGIYTAATASTTFTVNPEVPKLTFAPVANPAAGGSPFAVSATSASPGAISYSVISGPATVTGNTVTVTGVPVLTVATITGEGGTGPTGSVPITTPP